MLRLHFCMEMEQRIYMSICDGLKSSKNENKVCLLQKSFLGLKQSPIQWYKRFNHYAMSIGFERRKYDNCVYVLKSASKNLMFVLLYVDDMLLPGSDM